MTTDHKAPPVSVRRLDAIRELPSKPCFHAPSSFLLGCSFCRERWLLARVGELERALGHARIRNHDFDPTCIACAQLNDALAALNEVAP